MPKCEKCNAEFAEGKPHEHKGELYVHEGKVMCESCLVDAGVPLHEADKYSTYIKLHTDFQKGHI